MYCIVSNTYWHTAAVVRDAAAEFEYTETGNHH